MGQKLFLDVNPLVFSGFSRFGCSNNHFHGNLWCFYICFSQWIGCNKQTIWQGIRSKQKTLEGIQITPGGLFRCFVLDQKIIFGMRGLNFPFSPPAWLANKITSSFVVTLPKNKTVRPLNIGFPQKERDRTLPTIHFHGVALLAVSFREGSC